MIDKMLTIAKKVINILTYIMIGLWSIFTIIVIFFLIHRLTNPEWKSISNHDLKDYGQITIIVLLIVGFMFLLRLFINKRLDSK